VFANAIREHGARRLPVLDVMRSHGRTVLLAAGTYLSISTLGYVVLVYFVTYATRQLGLSLPVTLGLVVASAVVFAASIALFAHWSDRIGRRRLLQWGLGALVLWSLVFFPLADTKAVPLVLLSLAGMLCIQGAYIGPQPAVFSELFPTAVRYSGASLSLTLGTLLGGAIAPTMATTLFNLSGTSQPITLYITAMALLSWACSLGLPETFRGSLAHRD
jgi:MFS family permease